MSHQIQNSTIRSWLILAILIVLTVFQFIMMVSIGVMVSTLKQTFHVDAVGISLLSSSYFFIYVILQVPVGVLIDLYGFRRILTMAASVLALGCCVFSLSNTLWVAVLGRTLMGGGAAFGFVGMLYVIIIWFPSRSFSFLVSLGETVGMLGAALGSIVVGFVVLEYGWRQPMVYCVGISISIAIAISILIPRKGHPIAPADSYDAQTFTEVMGNLYEMIRIPQIWLSGVFGMLLFSLVTVFSSLWGVPFLKTVHGLEHARATSVASMAMVGIGLTSPIIGWISRRMAFRSLMIPGALGVFLLSGVLFNVSPLPSPVLFVLVFAMGACSSVYVLCYAAAKNQVRREMQGTTMAFTNLLVVCGGPLLQPMIAGVLTFRHGKTVNDFEIYTAADYQIALGTLSVCFALSVVLAFFLREGEQAEIRRLS